MTDEEATKLFWRRARKTAKEVDGWPKWKRLETVYRTSATAQIRKDNMASERLETKFKKLLDSSIGTRLREKVAEAEAKFVEAEMLMEEAKALANMHGLPFRSTRLGMMFDQQGCEEVAREVYVPERFQQKFGNCSREFVAELMGLTAYTFSNSNDWDQSQLCW